MPNSTPPPGPLPDASGRGSVDGQPDGLPPVSTGGLRGVGYGAIVLAAGLSSRMGENKVLLPWRDGKPLVAQVAAKYLQAGIDAVVVVTGRDAARVQKALAALDLRCIHNPDYANGEILSSVKVGLKALPAELAAVFIQPADMPCVPAALIPRLAAAHEPGWNVAPRFEGKRGHPVLLDRAYWRAMLDLPAGSMPRDALRDSQMRALDVEDEGVILDIDTRATYERALACP